MFTLILALAVVGIGYWRFKDIPLDRDYAPYAYHTLHGGWLRDGHADIKPPLIHLVYSWAHICYKTFSSIMTLPAWGSPASFRAVPFAGIALACISLHCYAPGSDLVCALLLVSPTMWMPMAATEWLTITLLASSAALASHPSTAILSLAVIGLLPWANQKNALLLPFLLLVPVFREACMTAGWVEGISAFLGPSLLILTWIVATGRLRYFWVLCWLVPKDFGRRRSLRGNALIHAYLLRPCIVLMVPFLIAVNWLNPWAWVLVVMVALTIAAKQIMPVHFQPWLLALALATEPTAGVFFGFGILWVLREAAVWMRPSLFYPVCFPGKNGVNYGHLIEDADVVADWLADYTKPDEVIWVNSWDNNIYLTGKRKAWCFLLPEMIFEPEEGKEPPRVIIHGIGHLDFDYDKYGFLPAMTTPRGCYTVLVRRTT